MTREGTSPAQVPKLATLLTTLLIVSTLTVQAQLPSPSPMAKKFSIFPPQQAAVSVQPGPGMSHRENWNGWAPRRGSLPAGHVSFSVTNANLATFAPAVTFESGGYEPESVAVADLNGDGYPDLVVANAASCNGCGDPDGVIAVLLGNGDGTFKSAATFDSGGSYAYSVAVADVNGDGRLDVLVTNNFGSVAVLLGNGDGSLRPAVVYPLTEPQGESVAVADVNGDGKPDLLASTATGQVNVLLGNGDGTFQPPVAYGPGEGGCVISPGHDHSFALADVNHDHKPDLLVTCEAGRYVSLMLGNGDGTFQAQVLLNLTAAPATVATADVNGDGNVDLLVATSSPSAAVVLLGNGDGTFQSPVTYLSSVSITSITVADVNRDGKPDLLLAGCAQFYCGASPDGSLVVLLGYGDGTFQTGSYFDAGGVGSIALATGDLDGDGWDDVVVANWAGSNGDPLLGTVGVLLNDMAASPTTTTTLASSSTSSTYGEPVTFTVTVKAKSGSPTGTVRLSTGTMVVGTATLSNGVATIVISSLPAGSDSITASYLAPGFVPSTSKPLTEVVNMAATSVSLTSSANPAGLNKSVTYTAALTSQYVGSIRGSVTFSSGSQTLGSVQLVDNSATVSTSFANVGTYPIAANYSGDSNNTASATSLVQKIVPLTYTVVSASPSPAYLGQPVTLTANVVSAYGTPTGTVTFYITNPLAFSPIVGEGSLSGGVATFTAPPLHPGKATCQAVYSGDQNFAPSSSVPRAERVIDEYPTSTSLTSSQNPSPYSQPVTITATVTAGNGAIPDDKTVKFFDGGKEIGTYSTSGGVATLSTSTLKSGIHNIKATYVGDREFGTSSGILNQVVTPYTTTTTLTSNLNPSSYGQAVTWTAAVTASGRYVPTGKVKFSGLGAAATLSNGVATLTKAWLNAGTYSIQAEYEGDVAATPSSSSVFSEIVNPSSTTTTVTSSANPSSKGQSITFTAIVTTSTGVNSAGTVTFTAGGVTLGKVPLNGNVATVATSVLPVGATVVQAIYNGETDFGGSLSTITQTVSP
jgi:hypothetical protein